MSESAFGRQQSFIQSSFEESRQQQREAAEKLFSPDYAAQIVAETQSAMHIPEIQRNLGRAMDAYTEARQNKNPIEVETPLGNVTSQTIELNIAPPSPEQKTFILLGGAISSAEGISTLGIALAAMGHRVLLVPHVLSKQTSYENPNFFDDFYKHEAENGTFSADAAVLERVIASYAESRGIEGNINLFGFSAGCPIMLHTAKLAKETELADKIECIHMVSPAGFFKPEQAGKYRRLARTAKVMAGFAIGEGIPTFRDENEWLLQMEAIGQNERRFPDALRLAYRCTDSTIYDISDEVDIPIFVGMAASDHVMKYDVVSENVLELAKQREEKGLAPIIPFTAYDKNKSHSYLMQGYLGQAIAMTQMTEMLDHIPGIPEPLVDSIV